jgi:hypothetical protein
MDIGAFTALSGALTSLKTIIEIAKAANNQQLNAAVLDVQGKLIEVQQQSLALQQENQTLRDELQGIKDTRDTASKLRFDGKVYWKQDDPDFPFCPICWDVDKRLVRLQLFEENAGSFHGQPFSEYRCLKHSEHFEVTKG